MQAQNLFTSGEIIVLKRLLQVKSKHTITHNTCVREVCGESKREEMETSAIGLWLKVETFAQRKHATLRRLDS